MGAFVHFCKREGAGECGRACVRSEEVLYRCMLTVQHVCVCVFWMCVQTGDIIRELDNVFRISSSLRLFNFFGGGGDINCDHTNPNFGSV